MDSLSKRKAVFVGITVLAVGVGVLAIVFGRKTSNFVKPDGSPSAPLSSAASSATSSSRSSTPSASTSSVPKYQEISGTDSSIFSSAGSGSQYKATLAENGFTYPEKASNAVVLPNSGLGTKAVGLNQPANIKLDSETAQGLSGTLTATSVITGAAAKQVMTDYSKEGLYTLVEAPATLDYAVITCKLQMNLKPGTGVNYTYTLKPYVCQSNIAPSFWKSSFLSGAKVNYNASAICDAQATSTGDSAIYKVLCLIPKSGEFNVCFGYPGETDPVTVLNPMIK